MIDWLESAPGDVLLLLLVMSFLSGMALRSVLEYVYVRYARFHGHHE